MEETMKKNRWFLGSILLLFSIGILPAFAFQQRGSSNIDPIRHVLFGDVTVEGDYVNVDTQQSIRVILRTISGQIWGRDTISLGGRYRFNNLANGEYYLEVEAGDKTISRQHIIIEEQRSSDRRIDITLSVSGGGDLGSSDTGVLYVRDQNNQNLFDRAQSTISKDPKKAADYLEEIVKDDPDDFEAWTELGTAQFQMKKHKEAEKAYENALTAKPDYLLAMVNLNKLYLDRKNSEEAIKIGETAVQTDPKSAEANYWLGEAYLLAKKGSKAVGYLNEALKLDPEGMADAHLRLATLYDMAGYKNLAAKEYSLFLEKRPDYKDRKKMEKYISENSQN